ncbi:NlpC/P60 family protein [Erythrobacter sp. CCH5-A1]|uniref:NlpC/P60 family protein n=1 Tax=Erythrobacter sp. CCH5-A1 TaxID=1768792 RepID=UPI00082F0582|nr:NlpC/P60 family protein [Erythrobacter sp. CCH5-A1]
MSPNGSAVAEAALGLVGCRFRLHGRDPATGLDCIGLVDTALAAAGVRTVTPQGYGLRNIAIDGWLPLAMQSGLVAAGRPIRAGDVLLLALGYAQHHLVIAIDAGSVVHAHAGLRRVVRQPREPAWQIEAAWRLASSCES